ncbi:hypothetical protein [Bradyrhizobium cenepequi]|uniref:hypothetical protein n=1 Tax=Bradyrhizobium cenepequi TaxID=2821403 RepID=UPI001CE29B7A|nr:hypothetical protein [Bradyrhizobium cenepequi]MCA6106942.1 hypothetical protein [Bradyrhizobium cenepequi]
MDGYYLAIGFIIVLAVVMFWEIVALMALSIISLQAADWLDAGKWTSWTLATQFGIPFDFHSGHRMMLHRGIHYLLFDTQAALVLFVAALAGAPLKRWLEGPSEPSEVSPRASGSSGPVGRD